MKYEEFRDINNRLKSILSRDKEVHIDNDIKANDKMCSISLDNKQSNIKIKKLVLQVINGVLYIANGSKLSSWNFTKGFTYIYLYHGSKYGIKGDIEPHSRVTCDFGDAFYTADNKEFALSSSVEEGGEEGFCYKLLCDLDRLSVYKFTSFELWALYTAVNREYIKDIDEYPKLKKICEEINSYDIVIGLIADDRSAYVMNNFLNNSMTDICMYKCMKYFKLGYQIVFKTEKSCKHLSIIDKYIVSGEEYRNILHNNRVRIGKYEKKLKS